MRMGSHLQKTGCCPSSLSGCARRKPAQRRGERRVEDLLAAAVAEFSHVGYEAATMSAIAARADAPIGSLYQFFPNKEAVARAVRTRYIEDVEAQWVRLHPADSSAFVDEFVDSMVLFVAHHPAFLALLDAPPSTLPLGPRHRLRLRLSVILDALRPRVCEGCAERVAETVLQLNKSMMGLYARAHQPEKSWHLEEYRSLLRCYLKARESSSSAVRAGAVGRPVSSGRGDSRPRRATPSRASAGGSRMGGR
ncbi:MAG: TetR/AcrR family transcriptional regulator [Planctomycetes bacterium]|nr:TetR/AcrR family transcriptional regulator [Planctomycetota bacterium]